MLVLEEIKRRAAEVGFDLCGVAPCRHLAAGEQRFRRWIADSRHASLGYLERHVDKRFDPRLLVEGAQTAVVCGLAYKNRYSAGYPAGWRTKVASYACSRDYHLSLRACLQALLEALRRDRPDLRGRAFVDTAPLAEKQLAVEAGLGWIGRQSLLVTPRFGTFVLLGELILCDGADAYDTPWSGSGCGACRACIDHCPAQAILPDRMIDARRCISRHTVERESDGAAGLDLDGWIFGCDACQNCCPYNRRAPEHTSPDFDPCFDPLALTPERWTAMTEAEFEALCGSTPLTRSGLDRIRRNIK